MGPSKFHVYCFNLSCYCEVFSEMEILQMYNNRFSRCVFDENELHRRHAMFPKSMFMSVTQAISVSSSQLCFMRTIVSEQTFSLCAAEAVEGIPDAKSTIICATEAMHGVSRRRTARVS